MRFYFRKSKVSIINPMYNSTNGINSHNGKLPYGDAIMCFDYIAMFKDNTEVEDLFRTQFKLNLEHYIFKSIDETSY